MRSALKNVKGRTVTGVTVELLGSKGARLLCANRTSGSRRAGMAGMQAGRNARGGAHRRNLSSDGADLSMEKGSRGIQLSEAIVFNLYLIRVSPPHTAAKAAEELFWVGVAVFELLCYFSR